MAEALLIDARDDVATLLEDGTPGEQAAGVMLAESIGRGHKLALHGIAAGAPVHKFGYPIGRATRAIAAGEHVHTHNVATALGGAGAYAYHPEAASPRPDRAPLPTTFEGYVRPDGRVGTRNEIWVLPTVGCVARTAERIAARASAMLGAGPGRAVDGVHAFTHPHGCSQLGQDLEGTRAVLASLACHPNAAGVLIVGLGCEENQVAALMDAIPEWRRPAVRVIAAQLSDDEVEDGVAEVMELAALARVPRTAVGLDRLVLGVKCGGSDGLSGLTANPLVGRVSDRVVEAGGRVVLTEIPEVFGAEQMLMDRAVDEQVFGAVVDVVNGFKRYFLDHGEPVSENPSPGNVAGGITTLEEKSLGAVQKAGRAPLSDVIPYAGRVRRDGLTLLEAPGNDAVSCTALVAAGATAILFTTGRGTPLGFPVPTIKIATNHALAARKPGWIDFDAGTVLDDGFEAAEAGLIDRIAAIASGEETAAERNGEREIAIWKRGVTL